MMKASAIPSLSFSMAQTDARQFAEEIGGAFERWGFAIIADHGIDADLIAQAERLSRDFFALPEPIKRSYHIPGTGGARGYTPFGIERAKNSDQKDLKEFWHMGQDLPAGHAFENIMPANVWPTEITAFEPCFQSLFAAFENMGREILSAIARYLSLDSNFFEDGITNGNSILRLIHYPPVPAETSSVRAAAHEDINSITLLLGAEEAGLQLLSRDGTWIPVAPPPGALVVNIGDMLQRLTNHQLPSTTHRVVNPPPERRGHARYSMPFFLHFRPDYIIKTLPQCVDKDHPDRYPDSILADAYLQQRLSEINLI